MHTLTSAEERFTAFASLFIRNLGIEVFEGSLTSRPYADETLNLTPYVSISHAGIVNEGMLIPSLSSYDDALELLKYQIDKYCHKAKRIIVRQWPTISCHLDDPTTDKKAYRARVRLLADDGIELLAVATPVPATRRDCSITTKETDDA